MYLLSLRPVLIDSCLGERILVAVFLAFPVVEVVFALVDGELVCREEISCGSYIEANNIFEVPDITSIFSKVGSGHQQKTTRKISALPHSPLEDLQYPTLIKVRLSRLRSLFSVLSTT